MQRKTKQQIAREVGISPSHLSNLIAHKRNTSIDLALAIHEASDGKIKAQHLVPTIKDTIAKGLKLLW